jgi:hypothetical protein
VRVSVTLDASPADLIGAAKRFGLEGIVAKRVDSPYRPGPAAARDALLHPAARVADAEEADPGNDTLLLL